MVVDVFMVVVGEGLSGVVGWCVSGEQRFCGVVGHHKPCMHLQHPGLHLLLGNVLPLEIWEWHPGSCAPFKSYPSTEPWVPALLNTVPYIPVVLLQVSTGLRLKPITVVLLVVHHALPVLIANSLEM